MVQAPVIGFCGRCGAPFTAASGSFCGRCGNPVAAAPPVASGYTYPVAPPGSVPAMQHKLSRQRLWIFGAGAVIALVVIMTVVVVVVRPLGTTCHFSCSSQHGPPLVGNSLYKNDKFGYSVEYLAASTKVASSDANGVVLNVGQGSQISFTGTSGTDVDGALQSAFKGIDSNTFQDLQPVGPVRGAEIGNVPAKGTAYKGNFVPPNGGASGPVGAIVMAASFNNVTVVTVMFSGYSTDQANQPYGLAEGSSLDYPITLTHFPGSP